MDAETFLDNFGTIADAPGGVAQLRKLILSLAVRGQLVAGEPADEPASVLLRRAAVERGEREASGELSRTKPVRVDEAPYEIPPNWEWAAIATAAHLEMGQSPPSANYNQVGDGIPFFQGKADFGSDHPTARYWCTKPTKRATAGDVLLSVRAPVGPTNLATEDCCIGRGLARLRPLGGMPSRWILIVLRAFEEALAAKGTGTTFVAVSKKIVEPIPIPVPPLNEQHRIVAKVDQLMQLCDDLEARQQARRHITTRLRASSLDALTNAETDDDLRTAWSRIQNNWATLADSPDSIEALRQSILQLAIAGRLAMQTSTEEPVGALLERCSRRKAELVTRGQLRERDSFPPPGASEYEHVLPAGWSLARLEQIAALAGGVAKGRKLGNRDTTLVPYLRVANVKAGELLLDEVKEIELAVDEVPKYQLEPGDVLLTEGGDWDKLGRSAIWRGEIPLCVHQNHIFRARPLDPGIQSEWLSLFTNSPIGRSYFQSKAKRTTNLASINMSELRSTPVPVPPAAEQERILDRVALLMAECDRLEACLRDRDARAAAFASAAVRVDAA